MPLALDILKKGVIRPRYILAITIVLVAVMVGMGLYEISASSKDVMAVLQEEAMSIAEAITIMGDNSLLSLDKTIDLVIKRASDNLRAIEALDYYGSLNNSLLSEIVLNNNIYQMIALNKRGVVTSSMGREPNPYIIDSLASDQRIRSLIDDDGEETIIDTYDDMGNSFIIGMKRRKGGAIAVITNADEILGFKKSIGIGNLIQAIGENEGIEYVVLQDERGLLLATKNVTEMRRVTGDSFLENALQKKMIDTRVYPYSGREVLEVVSPFQIDDSTYGLFRIGLSMKEANAVASRSKQRMVVISLVAIVIGVVLLSFLLVSQNYALLSSSYDKIQTYTGTVLENIADGIIVADNKMNISVFNESAEKIFGIDADELVGKSVSNLGDEMEKLFADAHNEQWTEHVSEITLDNENADNLELSINLSKIDRHEESLTIAVVRDMTEYKIMEENIKRTEQLSAMGKLASAVAHEVRNPLNAISMIAQRLGREFEPKDKENEYSDLTSMIKSESLRLNKIVEEFLKFARPPKLNRQTTDMTALLDETIMIVSSQATQQNIYMDKDYPELGSLTVDKEQMKQVFLNIMLNGVDAMPEGGTLSVKAFRQDKMLSIEISDTGKGIAEDVLPRIFDLYFTTKDTGTGLGLSIAQRIIAEHGGWIKVDSEVDKGTTFTILIPIA